MKREYKQIILLAQPYYLKGRSADKLHHLVVAKMMQEVLKEKTDIDKEVMMAAALLHDIGYTEIPWKERKEHWAKKVMQDHMIIGARLARQILKKTNFPEEKIEKVASIIATHDNPGLGLKIKSKEGLALREADILWMTTEEAFWLDVGRRTIQPEEWLEVLEKRFTKEKEYTDYLNTRFSKDRIKAFLKLMKNKL